MLLKICSKLLCLKEKKKSWGHMELIWRRKKKLLQLHKRINFFFLVPKSNAQKCCGMLWILSGTSWYISCGLWSLLPNRSQLWLEFPQPDCPTKLVHTHTEFPLGFLVLFCSFFFSFPFFLVILPTSSINQGEAVFSQLGSSCNIRVEFREMAGKLAMSPSPQPHLPFG